MRVTEVRVPRFNLGNAVTRETTIPSFLDGLGQLLTLLRTGSSGARKGTPEWARTNRPQSFTFLKSTCGS